MADILSQLDQKIKEVEKLKASEDKIKKEAAMACTFI